MLGEGGTSLPGRGAGAVSAKGEFSIIAQNSLVLSLHPMGDPSPALDLFPMSKEEILQGGDKEGNLSCKEFDKILILN